VDHELILRASLMVAYIIICVSSLVVRSKLSGSLVARRFSALAIASAIGAIAIAFEMIREDADLLGAWRPPGLLERMISMLSVPVPLIIMAIALASLARTYSRFAS